MSQFRSHSRVQGFTLVELLVVMSMLSLVMLGLGSGMRTMVKAESSIEQRLSTLDELRVARQFVLQIAAHVSARTAQRSDGSALVFEALPDSLSWIGVMPVRPGVGGLHQFRLTVEPDEDTAAALVLRYRPWMADVNAADWSGAQRRVLVKQVSNFQVEAQGLQPKGRQHPVAWPVGWQQGWPIPDRLPEQIRLSFVDALGQRQPWVIPVRATVQTDDSLTTVTVGGGVAR
ncbi:MAG: prepilin-type N-terminal cleavage/methylation domain-containing protein [Hydrogenophaga sp.]|nr:prepilin-type N-terminal cleavage/methylation domain-containing protein [Hydrogenophaga sp.]